MAKEVKAKPWDRLPQETSQAYRAARLYFDMGPGRSIDAVAAQLAGGPGGPGSVRQKGGKRVAPGHLFRWSSEFDWVARARGFDGNAARVEDEAGARERARRAAERERRRASVRDEEWGISEALKLKALQILQTPLQRTTTTSQDGLTTTIMEPAEWRLRDAVTMARLACDLARLAVDLPLRPGTPGVPESDSSSVEDNDRIPPDLAAQWRELAARRALEHQGLDDSRPD